MDGWMDILVLVIMYTCADTCIMYACLFTAFDHTAVKTLCRHWCIDSILRFFIAGTWTALWFCICKIFARLFQHVHSLLFQHGTKWQSSCVLERAHLKKDLVRASSRGPPSSQTVSGAGDTWRFWSWKKPCASLGGPKSLQTNTAQWVGAHGRELSVLLRRTDRISGVSWQKYGEQLTYAALAAAGVEPGGGLPSEDGDAATDRVAVVRLCEGSRGKCLQFGSCWMLRWLTACHLPAR